MSEVLLVGEMNPYGVDPQFALYHLPRHASGNRLRQILGLSDVDYEALDKINLCTGQWSMKAARPVAEEVMRKNEYRAVVMLGNKAKTAFGLKDLPPYTASGVVNWYVALPHPSGLNRAWNDPFSYARAREIMRKCVPGIPWGSCED